MIVVVLSPHRDDAALSLGLSIEGWLEAGHTVSVLNCFTQSDYAPYSDVDTVHANDRVSFASALRKREDVAWNKLLGKRVSFHDLDLLDAPLRLGCSSEDVLSLEIRPGDRALARVEGAIEKLARKTTPGALALASPLAIGGHIDHCLVQKAACNVAQRTPLTLAFYEDLPYAARGAEADTLRDAADGLGLDLKPVFALPISPDAQASVQRKARMAHSYDSQIDSDVVRSIAEFSLRYNGRERLWGNSAWLGSSVACVQDETA